MPTHHCTREPHRERGSVTVWLALAAAAMILCVGIAVDLAGQVNAQQQAQDVAAQAARIAGEQVNAAPAIRGQTPQVDPVAAKAAADAYLQQAGVVEQSPCRAAPPLVVTVTDSYQPIFLSTLGIGPLQVTGTSTARLVRAVQGVPR